MPISLKLLSLLALYSLLLFPSCQREKGCTDFDALNYNMDAEKNDGTCDYLYLSFLRIYLDSTHQLVQSPDFINETHEFWLYITSERYSGPNPIVIQYTNLNSFNEWTYKQYDDVVITDEIWKLDLFLDSDDQHIVTFTSNVLQLIRDSEWPNVAGIGFEEDGLHFEFITHR